MPPMVTVFQFVEVTRVYTQRVTVFPFVGIYKYLKENHFALRPDGTFVPFVRKGKNRQ